MRALILFSFIFSSHISLANQIQANIDVLLSKNATPIEGPNCWNAAMYVLGFTKDIRYVSPQEFDYFVKTQCHVIDRSRLQRGSLIRLWGKSYFSDAHAAVFLGNGQIFEKPNSEKDSYYSIKKMSVFDADFNEDLIVYYRIISQLGCKTASGIYCSEFTNEISYYDCSNNNYKDSSELNSLMNTLFYNLSTLGLLDPTIWDLQKKALLLLANQDFFWLENIMDRRIPITNEKLDQEVAQALRNAVSLNKNHLKSVLKFIRLSEENGPLPLFQQDFLNYIIEKVKKSNEFIFWAFLYQADYLIENQKLRGELWTAGV